MKKVFLMIVPLLVAFAVITAGCNKAVNDNGSELDHLKNEADTKSNDDDQGDDEGNNKPTNTVKLLETLTFEHLSYGDEKCDFFRFEYDEQNRITKIYSLMHNGDVYYTTTLTYEGDDLVKVLYSYNTGDTTMYEYAKNGNIITKKHTYSGSTYIPAHTNIHTIELDSDGLPIKQDVDRGDGNHYFRTYEYQDGNMTIERITHPTIENDYTDYTEIRSFTYDNQKGALYYCQTPKWYLILYLNDFGINNNVEYRGGTSPPRSYITYEYDNTGFPINRIRKTSGHMTYSEVKEEFIYITK